MCIPWSLRVAIGAFAFAAVVGCDAPGGDIPQTAAVSPPVEEFGEAILAVLPAGSSRETLETGRELYPVCSVCHGPDAMGTQLGPSLRGPEWIHITGEIDDIESVIRAGIDRPAVFPIPMPVRGGGNFDDEQIRAIATYVYALSRAPR